MMKAIAFILSASVIAATLGPAPAFAAMGACESAYVKSDPQDQIRLYTICMEGLFQEQMAGAHHNRGVAYLRNGDLTEAMNDFDMSLLYDSGYGLAYFNRAAVYAARGEHRRAIVDLDTVLELRPSRIHIEAHYRRGLSRQALGDYAGAIADFERVMARNILFLDPETKMKRRQRAEGALAKAYILATAPDGEHRNGSEAVALAESALEHGDSSWARAVLAAAYAEAGRFEDAVREQTLAAQMAVHEGADDPDFAAQLASYQAGQPHRIEAATCGRDGAVGCMRMAWDPHRMTLHRAIISHGGGPYTIGEPSSGF